MSGLTDVPWWELVPVVADPGPGELRTHLLTAHRMPATVLDAHDPTEWAVWHTAEHRTGHPSNTPSGHRKTQALDHTHPKHLPDSARKAQAA